MILSTSGGDSGSTSSLCSCYAPITLHNGKSSEGREGKRATARVNGHGADPVDQQLPLPPPLPSPLKSNLKKPIREEEQRQQQVMVRDGRRKVSWPDAHGRDLAHVQVFHSSAPEEGEFAVAGKSCICNIQ
ncbi:uncharacterized protein LOC141820425 [Curcuma longa]|uniref:uncharacterized protein LOC141820425 n=1 Tax=Curcuma longa TaxID=136217 RepID=UPI003D9F6C8C